jgi:hypothetical protein
MSQPPTSPPGATQEAAETQSAADTQPVGPPAAAHTTPRPPVGGFSTLALVTLFLDIFGLSSGVLLSLVILGLTRLARGSWRFGKAWAYWIVGCLLNSGVVFWPSQFTRWNTWWTIASVVTDAAATTLIFLFIVSARARGRVPSGAIALGLPLVAGSVVANVGQFVQGLTIDWLPDGPYSRLVDTAYYAQVVQLIPVLLIALATEYAFFGREDSATRRWLASVRTLVVVAVCAVGELTALLMLVPPVVPTDSGNFFGFLETVSFQYSLQGVAMALASFAWAIASRARARQDSNPRHSAWKADMGKDRTFGAR